MKLQHLKNPGSGWTEISAHPGDADAHPPLPSLRLDWPLGDGGPDRFAVGASLAFAPWMAGASDLVEPFSALTAQRLSEWFARQGVWASPGPVRTGGVLVPGGSRRLHLVEDAAGSGSSVRAPEAEDLRMHLVPSEEGSSVRGSEVRIATNAGILGADATGIADRHAMRLAVAVLVAASLRVGVIVAPAFSAESPEEFAAAARLLECVSLGLVAA